MRTDLPEGAPARAVAYEPYQREYWVRCDLGHTHYGEHGAAGLLMRHIDPAGVQRYYLQQRAAWTDHGGTYSVPGGALHFGESPQDGAMREAVEEMGTLPCSLLFILTYSDSHGGWAYHTVMMDSEFQFTPEGDGHHEHVAGGWYTAQEIQALPLHPGFASSWGRVRPDFITRG